MFNRKDAIVALAACSMLACASVKAADSTPSLTLSPSTTTMDDAASTGLLMGGLDKVGAGKPLSDLGINIYGWVEAGYTVNLRNNGTGSTHIGGGGGFLFAQPGNHVQFNQLDLRFERAVDASKGKFDVGGLVELLFGTDSNYVRSNGIEYQTPGDNPGEVPQFEIPQAYVDFAIPVGNGLSLRVGKFNGILGYETLAPTTTPFYTHSYIYSGVNYTNTGALASYSLNDQFSFKAGFSRGWDQATEDVNDAIDFLGQVAWTPNKNLSVVLNTEIGPQNADDNAHYRTVINPVVTYKLTDALSLGLDSIYIYDGGVNDGGYGDAYGIAGYVGYTINDYLTLNGRLEWAHAYAWTFGNLSENAYEITGGVTITPMPKDSIGKNLKIRPEVRYDIAEDKIYSAGSSDFRDNWTFAADVIFTF